MIWKIFSALLTVVVAAFLFSSHLTAQVNYSRIVFIDAPRALAAHPAGSAVADVQAQQQQELGPTLQQIRSLQDKARQSALTPEEENLADILIRQYRERERYYAEQVLNASKPAVDAVNVAIKEIADANGYSMVLDGSIAGQNGIALVVYATPGLDITDQVIARLGTR